MLTGLQTFDLPRQGNYKTREGAQVSVVQLNQDNIPAPQSAAAENETQLASLFNKNKTTYKLSPGDVLSIQLWAYPEITPATSGTDAKSIGYPIDPSGYIYLPLIGQVTIAGKTLAETHRHIQQQFARFLKHPDVVVRVLSYEGRRYFVNGQVMRSGQYTLNDQPISVYTALSMAGGINTQTGDNSNIQLIRQGQIYDLNLIALEKKGLSLHRLLIQPDDTLYINTKQEQKLYIMGESNRSQALTLRDQGMTLSDVLGESEGINPMSASAARVFVMRTDLSTRTSTVYHLNLGKIGNLALSNQFLMQKNDIVYIDSTGLVRWQRILNQILPFSSALYNYGLTGK